MPLIHATDTCMNSDRARTRRSGVPTATHDASQVGKTIQNHKIRTSEQIKFRAFWVNTEFKANLAKEKRV